MNAKRVIEERWRLTLFVLPALVIVLFAQAFPVLYSLQMSFRKWTLTSSMTPGGFAGLANYASAFHDTVFLHAFLISVIFCLVATTVEIMLGFILAYFVSGESRFLKISRTILILPMVIAPVATGTIWRMMLSPSSGLLSGLLALFKVQSPDWLGNPALALFSVIFIDVWQWTPFAMVVFIAGYSIIPLELYDAAKVDGANRLNILRHVIIPLMTPIIFIVLLFRIVDTFLVIDAIFTTTYGGPGFSTTVVTLYVYWQALRYFNISYSSALSWMISVLTLAVSVFLMGRQRRIQARIWGPTRN